MIAIPFRWKIPQSLEAMRSMLLLSHRVHVIVHAALRGNVLADPHEVQPVQPQIAGMAGIKARRNPDLSRGRQVIAEKLLVAIFSEVDCTRIRCKNESAVVSLQSHAGIEQGNAVFAYGYPIAANGAQRSPNPRPINLPTGVVEIHTKTFRQRSDRLRHCAAPAGKGENVLQ